MAGCSRHNDISSLILSAVFCICAGSSYHLLLCRYRGSSPFSGVSSLFTGVSCSFTSLFRRASLFPGVSPKLLIILVSTRFFWSSSLFSGVLYSCHQIFLKLHQLSLKLPITFFAMLDASIVVPNFQCYDYFEEKTSF